MSANNQTLIKEHEGKWYVFTNVNAESWCDTDDPNDKGNIVSIKEADGIFDTRDEAYANALALDSQCGEFKEGTEYGVQFNRLCKDDSEVKIIK